jgi:hypothetical protein
MHFRYEKEPEETPLYGYSHSRLALGEKVSIRAGDALKTSKIVIGTSYRFRVS